MFDLLSPELLARTKILHSFLNPKCLADLLQTVAGDDDAAVYWRVETGVIIY
jgi:hypothetical protein